MAIEIINSAVNQDVAVRIPKEITNRCKELATLVTHHTDGKGNGFHQKIGLETPSL